MAGPMYPVAAALDGCAADEAGGIGRAVPDEAVHAFINDLVPPVGTHLRCGSVKT